MEKYILVAKLENKQKCLIGTVITQIRTNEKLSKQDKLDIAELELKEIKLRTQIELLKSLISECV